MRWNAAIGSFESSGSPASGAAEGIAALNGATERWKAIAVEPALTVVPLHAARASRLGLDRYWVLHVPAGTDTPAMVRDVSSAAPRVVEAAELDSLPVLHGFLPTDALWTQQWGLRNTGQVMEGVAGIPNADADVLAAWNYTRGHESVVIAVLDTGISLSHPDVVPNRLAGRNFTGGNVADTDDNLTLSHGTHVSGIIAAASNTIGVVGVAPLCRVLPVKVATASFGSETWTGNGLLWATDQGVRIANLSLGHSNGGTFLFNAVSYAAESGVFICSSTGNVPGDVVGAPARWEPVVAVGATDNRDRCAVFTTTGPEMDISAPGVSILSTWDTASYPNTYSVQSGTSMASPMVAGAAALMMTINPSLDASEVRDLLIRTADDRGPTGWDSCFGWGRLNVRRAVLAARSTLPPCYADWNRDYVVTTSDVFDFLTDWVDGRADFNGNGVTETQDLFDFLESFSRGC